MTCNGVIRHDIENIPIEVKQGSDLTFNLDFTDANGDALDVSGRTFSGHVRPTALSSTLSASFTFDTTNASTGVVVARLPGSATALLSPGENPKSKESTYYYDMRYVVNSISTYFLQGRLTLIRSVTR